MVQRSIRSAYGKCPANETAAKRRRCDADLYRCRRWRRRGVHIELGEVDTVRVAFKAQEACLSLALGTELLGCNHDCIAKRLGPFAPLGAGDQRIRRSNDLGVCDVAHVMRSGAVAHRQRQGVITGTGRRNGQPVSLCVPFLKNLPAKCDDARDGKSLKQQFQSIVQIHVASPLSVPLALSSIAFASHVDTGRSATLSLFGGEVA